VARRWWPPRLAVTDEGALTPEALSPAPLRLTAR
jgi:hypothetical protein